MGHEDSPILSEEENEMMEGIMESTTTPSNVLIFYNLDASIDKEMLEKECASFGVIRVFKFIKLFRKAVVVFERAEDAERCFDTMVTMWNIEFGMPITDEELRAKQLLPPPNEKTFLISPPCSPPPDWKGGREHPPENVFPPGFTIQELTDKLYMVYEGENENPKIIVQRPLDLAN
eukprot:TRINITY_DN672_c0_g2_i2.p1 TRINITY_DN672_c0_g2~~TRINITY_DN672_c0_g2_i2.p1  ORF type:complete len:176 (+),score=35.98 TRINITY_DN672_c0_g2_i2:277-804(+)